MNKSNLYIILLAVLASVFTACGEINSDEKEQEATELAGVAEAEENMVHLSELKFNSLGMKLDTLSLRFLSESVEANGQLEVPPQHEASVTAVLGGNIGSIEVIEGDQVSKNQTIAFLSHPNLTKVQTEYVRLYQRMLYLDHEFKRQARLYDEKVGSGQTYQQTKAEYESVKAEVKGYEAQLNQLNLDVEQIQDGDIYSSVPVVSPIDGYIEKVLVQIGQYVDPQTTMFEIVDNEHVHADLMVFEKDVHKVKRGQSISFTVQSVPDQILTATIYSVGKQFEQNPRAVHVHAEIDQKASFLIPGMYINGTIHTSETKAFALPENAIVEDEGKTYLFTAEQQEENGNTEWSFTPVEIMTGIEEDGWVEVKLLEPLPDGARVAWNNAYYLISEMKKSQTSDDD
ncbi:efflux RND transporter periplasmic adaptor subunit [Gracilimonas tropica]|uniref:efflux RND transporter periplasmic adaptor subunit n=1 Tax=Gracilimonas tropica TaxID=454600 RepID=UPI00036E4AD4|nr:efflux RND transporter periplasmic adaptor subunit [Gracilimonas tropica]